MYPCFFFICSKLTADNYAVEVMALDQLRFFFKIRISQKLNIQITKLMVKWWFIKNWSNHCNVANGDCMERNCRLGNEGVFPNRIGNIYKRHTCQIHTQPPCSTQRPPSLLKYFHVLVFQYRMINSTYILPARFIAIFVNNVHVINI